MASSNALTAANKNITTMRAFDRVKIFWSTRNSRQRLYLGIGAAITLAAAMLCAQMIASPDYKPLISDLEVGGRANHLRAACGQENPFHHRPRRHIHQRSRRPDRRGSA